MQKMMGENDLRGLLAKSRASFHTLILEATDETDVRLAALGMKRLSASLPGSRIIESHASGFDEGQAPPDGLQLNGIWNIWWRRPKCWRNDYAFSSGGTGVNIACENEASAYEPAFGTLYTTRPPTERPGRVPSSVFPVQPAWGTIAERLQSIPLFSESFGMSGWALDPIGERTHLGRNGVLIRARWMAEERRREVWPFVDECHLLVDLERGVLLSCAGIVDGQQAVVMSVRSIQFDAVIPDTIFSFEPPVRTRVVWCRRSTA